MNAATELTVDSLIDAYLARNKHRNAHDDLREYHEKRLQMLQSLLGCDLEKRQTELDAQAQKMKKKGRSENDKYFAIDSQASMRFMETCVDLLSSTKSPFDYGVYLEGKPPKMVRDLSAKYEKKVRALEQKINQINRQILKDTLIYLFPGIENKKVKASKLYKMGLPKDEPDPIDYF